jgi:alkanesulfonate monooxygenase SsuD/methylene tetrahydromethanopterin reductase-like flavin-dependent oxidoreductase (luciferase family)
VAPSIRLRFDLRVPPFATTTYAAQYQACLEMVTWAERIGVTNLNLSEHHGDEAGYTPAPVTLAAAVLGRTRTLPVTIGALLAPLHDPVRLAEQLATVDLIAPGRLSVVVGAGYRKAEFAMAGTVRAQRGALVEEFVEVCRSAWTGQPFEWRGRTVLVTPTPATPGGPLLLVGGKSEAAGRRAARLRCGFAPANGAPELPAAYWAECEALGFEGGYVAGPGAGPVQPGFVMVTEDPEATWAAVRDAAFYDAATYASWQDDAVSSAWVVPDLTDPEDLRTSGRYVVVTPEECIAMVRLHDGLTLHPLMGGIAPDLAWRSLELFETKVLPAL